MPIHVAGIIRIVSVADLVATEEPKKGTEQALRRAIGPIPSPKGAYGPLRWAMQKDQAHSHDQNWGYVTIWGDLAECDDGQAVKDYWVAVNKGISNIPHVGVNQGVIHIQVDGRPAMMIDHFGAFLEGVETVGDE